MTTTKQQRAVEKLAQLVNNPDTIKRVEAQVAMVLEHAVAGNPSATIAAVTLIASGAFVISWANGEENAKNPTIEAFSEAANIGSSLLQTLRTGGVEVNEKTRKAMETLVQQHAVAAMLAGFALVSDDDDGKADFNMATVPYHLHRLDEKMENLEETVFMANDWTQAEIAAYAVKGGIA